jgi:hypothetical protein
MSDLFSPFRDAEQLPTPPVEDVRRRGDSLRRRRHALQAGGVAAVVAAVALAAVGVSGGLADRSSEIPPATQPTGTVSTGPTEPQPTAAVTTIPASFDIAQGLVDSGSDDELTSGPQVNWIADEIACDADHSPRDEETDRTAALLAVPQHSAGRDLRVFADQRTAQRVASDFVGWFRDCPTFSLDGGASETTNTVIDPDQEGSSWVVTQTYTAGGQPQLGQNILLIETIGNAVLVVKDYGEGPGATDEAEMLRKVATLQTETQPMVVQLGCLFGDGTDGC